MAFNPVQSFNEGNLAGQNLLKSQQQNQIRDLQNALAGQAGQGGFDSTNNLDLQRLAALDPNAAEKSRSTFANLSKERKTAYFQDAKEAQNKLLTGDIKGVERLLSDRRSDVLKLKGDTTQVDYMTNLLNTGQFEELQEGLAATVLRGQEAGYLSVPEKSKASEGLASAKTKVFDNGTIVTQLPDKTTQVTNPAGEVVTGDERVKILKQAREEQIGFAGATAEATAAGKVVGETSKANLVADAKSKIASAVKLAEMEAKDRGETLTDLSRAKASMPGLLEVVGKLRNLAPLVTNTMTGKGFNFMAKEFGFGSTKGGDARASWIGIIDNQILPLLKQTFGAAFTKEEGERLTATLGDVDSSPSEKMAQLDAFIEGKAREIQTKQREVGEQVTPSAELLSPEKKARLEELRSKVGF